MSSLLGISNGRSGNAPLVVFAARQSVVSTIEPAMVTLQAKRGHRPGERDLEWGTHGTSLKQ